MTVFAPMMGATGITAIRVVASPERTPGNLARVVVAGTLATAALTVVERVRPREASSFAVLVFITALLVHGVALAQIAQRAANITPTPEESTS